MKKKWIISLSATALLLSATSGAYAAANLPAVQAFLNPNIKFKFDGKPFQPTNEQGQVQPALTYNNSTYLPVRAISDALGVAVDYDQASNTISLGEKVDGVSLAGQISDGWLTKDPALTTYNGKDYKEAYFDNNIDSRRSSSFMLYPEGKYQTLYLQVAAIGADIPEIFVQDENDAKLKIETVSVSEGLKTIEVNIGGAEELFIHADLEYEGSMFVPLTTSYFK